MIEDSLNEYVQMKLKLSETKDPFKIRIGLNKPFSGAQICINYL